MSTSPNKDDEFLLWLAKRLVFKYGENKQIIDIVTSIITKNQAINNSLDSIYTNIEAKIYANIKISHEMIKDLQINKSEMVKRINDRKNSMILSTFEDLNVDDIIK